MIVYFIFSILSDIEPVPHYLLVNNDDRSAEATSSHIHYAHRLPIPGIPI